MIDALIEAFSGPVLLPALAGAAILVCVKIASIWAEQKNNVNSQLSALI